MNANQLVGRLFCVLQTGSADYSHIRWDRFELQTAHRICHLKMSASGEGGQEEGRLHGNERRSCGSPWQMLLSEVPLMWKPASQLQCCSWFTWEQRGFRLKAGSFTTLHSGGAAEEKPGRWHRFSTNKQTQSHGVLPTCLGFVLAVRSAPPLGAGAPVPRNPFHTGTSIPARVAGTLAHDCRWRAEGSLQPSFMLSARRRGRHLKDTPDLCKYMIIRHGDGEEKVKWLWRALCLFAAHVDKKRVSSPDVQTVERRLLVGSFGAEATAYWSPTSPFHV